VSVHNRPRRPSGTALHRRPAAPIAPALIIAVLLASGCSNQAGRPRLALLAGADGIRFVDDGACRECHEAQDSAWTGSDHDLAMQPATAATVLADFDDAVFAAAGDTLRFLTRNNRFFVRSRGTDGVASDFEVLYTFGFEPLQQYLVSLPGGRLQAITVAWDVDRGAWFDLYPEDRLRPGDPIHWTGRLQRWNDQCAECHSTDLRVGYDPESDTYRTTWAAVDVSCQACHGPGEEHVAQARAGDLTDPRAGLVVDFEDPATTWLDTCARCHSRRSRVRAEDMHGRDYFDDFSITLLRDDIYYPDGQILGEVYVAGSFLQSLMHRRGVTCTECHDPHSTGLIADGNALCTSCHNTGPPAAFPTLRAREYDSPDHHRHEPGTAGAGCVDCHMPESTFMVVDPRRDHSIRIPRPDLGEALGTPDACTGCHTGETPAWAAARIEAWTPMPARPPHYGQAIAAARSGEPDAVARLVALVADTGQPAIARATALDLLGQHADRDAVTAIASSITDPDPLIRLAAIQALEQLPATSRPSLLLPTLGDSIAAVRSAAARMLAPVASRIADAGARNAIRHELDSLRAALRAQAGQPEAWHGLGELAAAQGQPASAEEAYRTAIRTDSAFVPSRVNLAMLYNEFGRNSEAETLLRDALDLAPRLHELHYSLGLLLAEQNRMQEAEAELAIAADSIPDRARVFYNLGLVRQRTGDADGAGSALLRAHELAPADPAFVNALVHFHRDQGNLADAERFARILVRLLPADPAARDLLESILAGR
jgi:predicted CXXCH cytochrome family protein